MSSLYTDRVTPEPRKSKRFSRTVLFNLLQRAAGENGPSKSGAFNIPRRVSVLVAVLDEDGACGVRELCVRYRIRISSDHVIDKPRVCVNRSED